MKQIGGDGDGFFAGFDLALVAAAALNGSFALGILVLGVLGPERIANMPAAIAGLVLGSLGCLMLFPLGAKRLFELVKTEHSGVCLLFWVAATGQALCSVILFAMPEGARWAAQCFGWLFAFWGLAVVGCCFSALPLRRRVVSTVASTVGACLVTAVLVVFGAPSGFAVLSVLPLGAGFCMMQSGPFASGGVPTGVQGDSWTLNVQGEKAKFAAPFLFAIFAYSCAWAMEVAYLGVSSCVDSLTGLLSSVAAVVILTLHKVKTGFVKDANTAYRPAPIAIAIGFLILSLGGMAWGLGSLALVCAGFSLFFVYYWIVVGNHVQRFEWSCFDALPKALILLAMGMAAGFLIAYLAVSFGLVPGTVPAIGLFFVAFGLWTTSRGKIFANEPDEAKNVFETAPAAFDDGAPKELDPIEACAQRWGLSQREAEITRLLAKGRNVPFICDELFIAKSTVQTHIKHIYAKAAVSSRQELIDLIEAK